MTAPKKAAKAKGAKIIPLKQPAAPVTPKPYDDAATRLHHEKRAAAHLASARDIHKDSVRRLTQTMMTLQKMLAEHDASGGMTRIDAEAAVQSLRSAIFHLAASDDEAKRSAAALETVIGWFTAPVATAKKAGG